MKSMLGRYAGENKMVGHQKPAGNKKILSVAVIAKDRTPLDASHDDVVQCSRRV
jgi:hypothetical protein